MRADPAWRPVVGFGVVSLAADMVYEGARAVTGPLLASLGATAVLVGLVSGLGEGVALLLRVLSGSWADRSGHYWRWTIAGYAITAACVPALAVTPFLGAAGLAVGGTLIIAERFGKAVRSPAKTVLLAQASAAVGLGRGFGVHKALDQLGAFAGPLLVAAVIGLSGAIWTGLAVLAVPGAAAMLILLVLRRSSTDPTRTPSVATAPAVVAPSRLPAAFWTLAAAAGAATAGLVTFAIIGYHLVDDEITGPGFVPVIYATRWRRPASPHSRPAGCSTASMPAFC